MSTADAVASRGLLAPTPAGGNGSGGGGLTSPSAYSASPPVLQAAAAAVIVCRLSAKQVPWLESAFVPACVAAGLAVRAFKGAVSIEGKYHVYVEVSADDERLLREAARLEMPLQLDSSALRAADIAKNELLTRTTNIRFSTGDNEFVDKAIPPLKRTCATRCLGTSANPYEHIWAPFRIDAHLRPLYYVHKSTRSILSSMQSLKLLKEAIEAPPDAGGAGLNLDRLRVKGKLESWYIPHEPGAVADLRRTWAGYCQMPWDQPLEHVKSYLGERVAFYYSFLSFITIWLVIPAIVGAAVFGHQVYTGNPSVSYLPAYGIFVSVWATVFFEFWKRRQAGQAMTWGTSDFRRSEPLRPEYLASGSVQRIRSPVTGRPDLFESPLAVRIRIGLTTSVVGTVRR